MYVATVLLAISGGVLCFSWSWEKSSLGWHIAVDNGDYVPIEPGLVITPGEVVSGPSNSVNMHAEGGPGPVILPNGGNTRPSVGGSGPVMLP